jgi:Uma2 family endonuclease
MLIQSESPIIPRQTLPTMYDLPSENPEEPGLPDEFHLWQSILLALTFIPINWNPNQVFKACDLNLYYDVNHPQWYKRPDWFGVVGVDRLYEGHDTRLSYVIWQEKISPFVVVELLSPDTEDEDFGRTVPKAGNPPPKWQVYEKILQVPYYAIFSRYTNELQAFHLTDSRYEAVTLTDNRLLMPELGLSLGLWRGSYEGVERLWLRWFTIGGELIPIPIEEVQAAESRAMEAEERALSAQERVWAERQRAIEAEEKAAKLAARLRELGINPDELE